MVDQCSYTQCGALHQLLWDDGLWHKLFHLYLEQSHLARPKSAKQLLATLSSSWLKTASELKDGKTVAADLVVIFVDTTEIRKTKASIQASTHFLSKGVLAIDDMLAPTLTGQDERSTRRTSDSLQELLSVLFRCIRRGDVGSATGQLVTVLLDRDPSPSPIPGASGMDLMPIWVPPLAEICRSGQVEVADLRLHIFPVLFKRSLLDYLGFLQAFGLYYCFSDRSPHSDDSPSEHLLYAALQSGKELGLLYETDDDEISPKEDSTTDSTHVAIPVRFIGRMLRNRSGHARLTGLSLLITSHSATRPFPAKTFRLLKRYLHIFMGDTDANFRGELFSLMQRLMDRLRAVSAAAQRQAHISIDAATTLAQSRDFLQWHLRYLSSELRPTTSYQHHICALKTLLVVARSGLDDAVPGCCLSKTAAAGEAKWPFHLSILTPELRRMLLDILLDPFDDVRQTSSAILGLFTGTGDDDQRHEACAVLADAIGRAESMMLASGRADQADGVAHLYALLYRERLNTPRLSDLDQSPRQIVVAQLVENLERLVGVAKSDLAIATSKYPLHGLLTSLRYVLSQDGSSYDLETISQRLTDCLHELWKIVRPVLCNDAPEGYAPVPAEEMTDVSTKDTLSYCWRALKESSLLAGCLLNYSTISTEHIVSLSNLCFTQLAELRHRGAFSTVAQTWISCCLRCRDMKTQGGVSMTEVWYNKALSILEDGLIINTRRSAGLPSLMCGLLISDRSKSLLARVFEDLTTIARLPVAATITQESSLPQAHAMNCMKDILKSTRLGEESERYIPHCVRLAADSLRSEAWAVRNCGLMLFRAVIDRLLGTSEVHLDQDQPSSIRISAQQYPELLDIVLDLIQSSDTKEGIFPALQLLQSMHCPAVRRDEIEAAVFTLTASTSWHIREKAARVYASIAANATSLNRIETALATARYSHNALHGALLCAKHVAARLRLAQRNSADRFPCMPERIQSTKPTHLPRLAEILANCSWLYYKSTCPVVKAAYIDATEECGRNSSLTYAILPEVTSTDNDTAIPQRCFDARSELRQLLRQQATSVGDGVLLLNVSRATILSLPLNPQLVVEGPEQIVELILQLAHRDADACSSLLRRVALDGVTLEKATQRILIKACASILGSDPKMSLKCEALRFLLRLSERRSLFDDISPLFLKANASASDTLQGEANQTYADQCLELGAVALTSWTRGDEEIGSNITRKAELWASSCCRAIQQGESSVYSREAAASALNRVHPASWSLLERRSPSCFMQLCLAVYDLLIDDDEDTRSLAATITAVLLTAVLSPRQAVVLEPGESKFSLLRFMLARWSNDKQFAAEACARAFDLGVVGESNSMDEILEKAVDVDTALFAEEKQNLYIDETTEVKTWGEILLRPHVVPLPQILLNRLARRTMSGLESLLRRSAEEADGALGWSTKPGVFTIGLQVVYGAEVLLHLAERGRRLPVRPSSIRLQMGQLAATATTNGVNELWLREIRRVLNDAVLRQFKRTAQLAYVVSEATRI